jgi:hypothetical protein
VDKGLVGFGLFGGHAAELAEKFSCSFTHSSSSRRIQDLADKRSCASSSAAIAISRETVGYPARNEEERPLEAFHRAEKRKEKKPRE